MFAKGTKGYAPSGSVTAATSSLPRSSTGSAYDGFGALMNTYSDDSDDSDRQELSPAQPAPASQASYKQSPPQVRESWGARAMAVGERPPDSMSQNPPTLKLLGLKSQHEVGQAFGPGSANSLSRQAVNAGPGSPNLRPNDITRPNSLLRNLSQEQSFSEYGDGASRIGSTIDFTGHGSDGFGGEHFSKDPATKNQGQPPLNLANGRRLERTEPLSGPVAHERLSRKALTTELGLDADIPTDLRAGNAPSNPGQNGDYFARGRGADAQKQTSPSCEQSAGQRFSKSPQNVIVHGFPSFNSSGSLMSPGSVSSMDKKDPFENLSQPASALVVGPCGIDSPAQGASQGGMSAPQHYQHQQRATDGSPVRPYSPGLRHPGQEPLPQALRAVAGVIGQSGVTIPSRAPAPQKRQSIFRRSMAFMTGTDSYAIIQQSQPYQQQRGNPGGQGAPRRQSIFRRSMAFLSGRPMPMPEPAEVPENHPAPRVRGFELEKELKPRNSQYLGGGGKGDEWDVDGAGAKFWARFDQAQKHANSNDKMEMTSRTFRQKVQAQRKLATVMAGLGGIVIIGGVVGIIVWRESSSDSSNGDPTAINKGEHGGTDTRQRRSPMETPPPRAEMSYHEQRRADFGSAHDVWVGARIERNAAAFQATPAPHKFSPLIGSETLNNGRVIKRHVQMRGDTQPFA